jgi:hypothetical protein
VAGRDTGPDAVAGLPSDRAVLDRIADGAERSSDGVSAWSPDGWVMRTHPDLTEALERAAAGTGLSAVPVHGVTTLLDPAGRIAAVGWGTGRVWLRVAPGDGTATDGRHPTDGTPVEGLDDFVAIDAWTVPLGERVAATARRLASDGPGADDA